MDHTKAELLSRPASSASLLVGQVVDSRESRLSVRTESGEFFCERAASCLLLPTIGDRVLLSAQLPDEIYVLAVLVRHPGTLRQTELGEGVVLEVGQPGRLEISATNTLQLRAGDIGLLAQSASMLVAKVSLTVREAFIGFTAVRWVGGLLEGTADRVTQWIGASQRTVKGLDQSRSGSSEVNVDQIMSIRGQQVLISAEKLAKIDGDQVHIG